MSSTPKSRFPSGVMLRRMQNVEANFEAIRETAQSVPFRRLRTAWIFDAARQFGAEAAMEVARWASKLQTAGVVAFGMGGDELPCQPEFSPRFRFRAQRRAANRLPCRRNWRCRNPFARPWKFSAPNASATASP